MCVEVHPLEAEIADCNESVTVLRNMMRNFVTALDGASPTHIPEHRASGSPYIEHIRQLNAHNGDVILYRNLPLLRILKS